MKAFTIRDAILKRSVLFDNLKNFIHLFSKKQRLIVYGDIHGCYDEFTALRKKIGIRKNDIEVCAGDFITKGKDSLKVLRFIKENKILVVLGNHEDKLIRYQRHKVENPKKKNPIELDDDEKKIIKELSGEENYFLEKTPLFLKFGVFTIVHGGLQNYMKLDNLKSGDRAKILRMRYLDKEDHFLMLGKETKDSVFWGDVYDGNQGFVVFGHKRSKEVIQCKHCLGIDTGCVYGGKLTAVVIDDIEKKEYKIIQK